MAVWGIYSNPAGVMTVLLWLAPLLLVLIIFGRYPAFADMCGRILTGTVKWAAIAAAVVVGIAALVWLGIVLYYILPHHEFTTPEAIIFGALIVAWAIFNSRRPPNE
jgi:hypothetical protein